MEYKKSTKPLELRRVTLEFVGEKSWDAAGLLQAFHYGATGEPPASSFDPNACTVVMDLDSDGEFRLNQFLTEVIEKM